MAEQPPNPSFARAFIPGLIVGLVIGLVAGAVIPTFLERPASLPADGAGKARRFGPARAITARTPRPWMSRRSSKHPPTTPPRSDPRRARLRARMLSDMSRSTLSEPLRRSVRQNARTLQLLGVDFIPMRASSASSPAAAAAEVSPSRAVLARAGSRHGRGSTATTRLRGRTRARHRRPRQRANSLPSTPRNCWRNCGSATSVRRPIPGSSPITTASCSARAIHVRG